MEFSNILSIGDWELIGTSTIRSFSFPEGTHYEVVKIYAEDQFGNYSSPSKEYTINLSPPTPPTNLAATTNNDMISVSWDASTSEIGIKGYRIYSDGNYVAYTTNTSYTLSANSYYVSLIIIAEDNSGNTSSPSEEFVLRDLQYNYVNDRLDTITYKNTNIVLYRYIYDANGNLISVEAQ
ncbi:MAG TPA: hypothetical protein VNS08_17910 [Ureibacillus sp.]|nr:hypothetical protein [Ureibacillus sp.]